MPSSAIEASAEITPLTDENLYHTLVSASSTDPVQIQSGAKQLQNWEHVDFFFSNLQSIYMNYDLPWEVRGLAIIQLKNAVDKYWRRSAQRTLDRQEKDLIRSRCVESVLDEPLPNLARQSAIFTAKVLRCESPRDWATAVQGLVAQLNAVWQQQGLWLRLHRILLLLLYVVKELTSATLGLHRTVLRSIAQSLAEAVFEGYVKSSNHWLMSLQSGDRRGLAVSDADADSNLLALRTLRRLLVFGFQHPNRDPTVCEIWPALVNQLGHMLKAVSPASQTTLNLKQEQRRFLEKHIMQIAKLHLNMARDHPAAYVLLPGSIELTRSYWDFITEFNATHGISLYEGLGALDYGSPFEDDQILFPERFSLMGLLLLRACMKMAFNPVRSFKFSTELDKGEKVQAIASIKSHLFTVSYVQQMLIIIINQTFVFTRKDLIQWEEEPEEWVRSQEGMGEDWEYSLRVCAEKLFLDFLTFYKVEPKPNILPYIDDFVRTMSPEQTDVFLKDAIYTAIGLAAPVLYDTFDFPGFIKSHLVSDVQVQKPEYKYVRRRVAITFGQWLPVKEGLDRPLVYRIFSHLLDKSDPLNDTVVRVTAGMRLGEVIDPFDFRSQEFAPFASVIIQRLIDLVPEAELQDTKLAILNTIHVIVVKMEDAISPFGDQILKLLSPLWEGAGDELLIKENILAILTCLVGSMKADFRKYHLGLIPLLASATSAKNNNQLLLAEESMNLWSAILDETISPAPQPIIDLLDNLLPMLEHDSDMLDRALSILDAYILLMPSEMTNNASVIIVKFVPIVGDNHREAIGLVTHALDLIFISAIKVNGYPGVEQVVSSLISTHFLFTILHKLFDAHEAHKTAGPNQRPSAIDSIVETDFLSVLARIAVASPALLISAYDAASPGWTIEWLVDEWFSHIDDITQIERKKLACLALTSFLETGSPWILGKLQLLMSMWTDLLTELETEKEDEITGQMIKRDCLMCQVEDFGTAEVTPSLMRSRELLLLDPVHSIDMRADIRHKLGAAIGRHGGLAAFTERWVDNVDKDVVTAFANLGVL